MSIQEEFRTAAAEYARRLDQQREEERLTALRIEARRENNALAFTAAIEGLEAHDRDPSQTNTSDLDDLLEAIRKDSQS